MTHGGMRSLVVCEFTSINIVLSFKALLNTFFAWQHKYGLLPMLQCGSIHISPIFNRSVDMDMQKKNRDGVFTLARIGLTQRLHYENQDF